MWGRFDEMQDLAIYERMMQVNYLGAVYLTHAALPALKASKGSIATVASLAGLTGVPYLPVMRHRNMLLLVSLIHYALN